jgi:hypothetical protein
MYVYTRYGVVSVCWYQRYLLYSCMYVYVYSTVCVCVAVVPGPCGPRGAPILLNVNCRFRGRFRGL